MWRLVLIFLASPALAQGFDPESGIPQGGLHPVFPKGFTCPPITSYYASWLDVDGTRREDVHEGIDLGNWGDAILAPADGTVVAVWATDVSYGPEWNLLISHKAAEMGLDGDMVYFSEFDHLGADVSALHAGQTLERGQKIASVQVPGGVRSYIPETHWETYRLPASRVGETYWADNGLERGFLTWFNPYAVVVDPLSLMALHQEDRKKANIIAYDVARNFDNFVGFTYPLACVKR